MKVSVKGSSGANTVQTQALHAHGQESRWFMFITVQPNMNDRYRVFRRPRGVYYCEDLESGKQQSLKTRDKQQAFRLVAAKNEADASPAFTRHLARVYWQAGDPQAATRTWQQVMEEIPKLKQGSTRVRWLSAVKNAAFNSLRKLVVLETRPEDFLSIMEGCNVSTNSYLRRIHCFALDMNWLPWPVLPRKRWPVIRFKDKRAISWQEHQKILLGENTRTGAPTMSCSVTWVARKPISPD